MFLALKKHNTSTLSNSSRTCHDELLFKYGSTSATKLFWGFCALWVGEVAVVERGGLVGRREREEERPPVFDSMSIEWGVRWVDWPRMVMNT